MLWVLFVFLSYQDRNVVEGELLDGARGTENDRKDAWFAGNGALCSSNSSSVDYLTYRVSVGRREVRSVVNPRGGDLVDCSVIKAKERGARVKSFMRAPRPARRGGSAGADRLSAGDNRFVHGVDEASTASEFRLRNNERAERTATQPPWPREGAPQKKRSKRGFTYPGTLWCGAGNMADHEDHLGDFAETDSCCRTHDHCPHVIHAFSSNYGYTNFKWHSICHCDCDIAMKQCLRKVNDTASRVVGQAFFNVIGVPCFLFVYEDHCAERHWYGLCKRYEKLPVAVPQPAVPYDFGGIDIIDVLPVAPPPATNVGEWVRRESTTQSQSVPAPRTGGSEAGESSLVTVVTAAEDFIKVLATVSTSQGSPVDTAKEAMSTAEEKKKKKKKKKMHKKKRKNNGKRKKSQSHGKRKGKGRGREVKSHTDTGVEDVLVASSSKAGDGNNFITELKTGRSGQNNNNRFVKGEFDRAGQEGASNELMKDEPATDKEAPEVMSPSVAVPKEQVTQATDTGSAPLSVSTSPAAATTPLPPLRTKASMSRKGGQRRRKKVSKSDSYSRPDNAVNVPLKENSPWSSTIRLANISAPSIVARGRYVNSTARQGQQRPKGRSESQSPDVKNQTKRSRSEEEGGAAGGRQKPKREQAVPIVPDDHKDPTEDSMSEIGSVGAPLAPAVPPTKSPEPNVSHRPEIHRAKSAAATTPALSRMSVLKTKCQRSKGTGRQRRRGKSPFNGSLLLVRPSEHVVPAHAGPSAAESAAVVTRPCEGARRSGQRRPQRAQAGLPLPLPFSAATQRPTRSKTNGDKTRNKPLLRVHDRDASPAAPSEATPGPGERKPPTRVSENTFLVATAGAPVFTYMQLSVQNRVREQFDFKKRRKALLFSRQQ
ncbi:hypothetical protein NHX12_009160 [Muraenolepis orangiensis]|uniref:Phospholipase A2-like central domain-containing protein n=1 Tax=Muraenolepis orangiensis TaxID=630683 RepID=A0A9Q0DPI0_9TELE|nr:hypothetical protein NHX12_009160 [Muraenolepis orangiensis]